MPRVLVIRGDGVAARCCLRLLDQIGFRVQLESVERPKLPAIMLGEFKVNSDFIRARALAGGWPAAQIV